MTAEPQTTEPKKTARKKLTDEQKAALKELKAWRGDAQATRLKEVQVEGRKIKKAVREAMTQGPATIPELASATGLPSRSVLWHVTAMKKYGEVRESEVDGDYPRYEWIPKA
ncbi:MAG: winged helix-turn-helix domain-containing protein [Verrucomicrobia bacterium]|nr:winged helix-turn-helix domain-containing protein [Kiritimatiellia bacterium]MCB1101355.1 winged helix-turn-helix domain-containing protein [Kiritimatiellia bacterium]MCP5487098.1 winged helix-turn-helix domain-containing protein [Verrucomicrobiota bacterium]